MNISRAHALARKRGLADYFTGAVWLEELSPPASVSDVRVLFVTFEHRARTAWHTHPHGQLLRIIVGEGRVQKAGGAVQTVRPGDVVWIEAGERHWHGAAPDQAMTHLAVQRTDEAGHSAAWQEHVSDADYEG